MGHRDVAVGGGPSERVAMYRVSDGQLSTGSTLGAPRVCTVIKATGAIEKVYSIAQGQDVFGTVVLHHWDEATGMHLAPRPGSFTLHPEHQERDFDLSNGVAVHEDIFVLNGPPDEDAVDPPATYYTVRLRNEADRTVRVATYAFCQLGGQTTGAMTRPIEAAYDEGLRAIVAWEKDHPEHARLFGCSARPVGADTAFDHARAVSHTCPGVLSDAGAKSESNPIGALQLSHTLRPGEDVSFYYLLTFSHEGRAAAARTYRSCPSAADALNRTMRHYHDVLGTAVVLTPNPQINRGVLWAKANMLRSELKAPTGWSFTNNPTRSSHSVARDTAWFAYGADYITPCFAREALSAFVSRQEPSGLIVEYYDMRSGETTDLGLNVNDDTPLLLLALWHHVAVTGDEAFLRDVYPSAARAARYLLAQRNEQGLVWCTADGTGGKGIIGWRNAIEGYRLSGATTEVNSECYAALRRVAEMARALGRDDEGDAFAAEAAALKRAINAHLYNPDNGLYYLNIDVDGRPRSDVTSDLVFPVIFEVADDATAARIVKRLSGDDFWTEAGIRVVPRDAPTYSPDLGSGLLGGVWVGVAFWFAFAAARFSPEFMDRALGTSFQTYSRAPQQNNTVPGQFSEWLDGETLVNRGMMLSPWFPPRYLWAAIEGMAGLDLRLDGAAVRPRLAADWQWLGVRNLPYRGRAITWLAVRAPDVRLYATHAFQESPPCERYDEDITAAVRTIGEEEQVTAVGLRRGADLLLFAGNTSEHTVASVVRLEDGAEAQGTYRLRVYDSLMGTWSEQEETVSAERLTQGLDVQIERKGFWLLDLTRAV